MIRVLVVDDSAYIRYVLQNNLADDLEVQIVGTARDGLEALAKIKALKPDVVTLDLEMPRMDGFTALAEIMADSPLPVIILSSLSHDGADATIRALKLGAVEFVPKPDGAGLTIGMVREELLQKIKLVSGLDMAKVKTPPAPIQKADRAAREASRRDIKGVVVIGTSTGGPRALHQVIPQLPASFPGGVLIVQHMPSGFTKSLAHRLNEISPLEVREAQLGDVVRPRLVLIAPGDYHMRIALDGSIILDQTPSEQGVRPAVNVTMESAAQTFGSATIGVILTGMGHDGTRGAKLIKNAGGQVIAEDKSTCIVYGMPRSAIEAGLVDKVSPLHKVASEIIAMADFKHWMTAPAIA